MQMGCEDSKVVITEVVVVTVLFLSSFLNLVLIHFTELLFFINSSKCMTKEGDISMITF